MREMVFRERQEKVAHFTGMVKALGRLLNADSERVFGDILMEYAGEVFQEDYDVDLARQKVDRLKATQRAIAAKRKHEQSLVSRLDKMGEYYDKTHGKDIRDTAKGKSPSR